MQRGTRPQVRVSPVETVLRGDLHVPPTANTQESLAALWAAFCTQLKVTEYAPGLQGPEWVKTWQSGHAECLTNSFWRLLEWRKCTLQESFPAPLGASRWKGSSCYPASIIREERQIGILVLRKTFLGPDDAKSAVCAVLRNLRVWSLITAHKGSGGQAEGDELCELESLWGCLHVPSLLPSCHLPPNAIRISRNNVFCGILSW